MVLYAGTSGWAYSSWKPAFYPAKLPAKEFLAHYSRRLNAVEVNYSFHRMVPRKLYESWAGVTPARFKFAIKAHQRITHIKRLRDVEEPVRAFLSSIGPLYEAGKLGPVLFQLPPNLKKDLTLLDDFLSQLPRTLRYAVEFRHESWLDEDVFHRLRRYNVAICAAESEKLVVPDIATANFYYYRFRRPDYAPEEIAELAARVQQRARERKDVFAFFKHEERPESALSAEELLRAVRAKAA